MIEITKDTVIGDILDIAPQTAPISFPSACIAWAARLPAAKRWKRPAWSTAWMWTSSWRW